MIILLLMIGIIFFIISKNITDKDLKKRVFKYVIIGLIFQSLLFVLYRMNLQYIGREVYFSDSEMYWEATKAVMRGEDTDAYNKTYIYMCVAIQKTSIFTWVGWNNIFNILCIDLSIVLIMVIIYNKSTDKKYWNLYFFLFCSIFNPLIVFSLMRNLKDALFLLIVVIDGYLLEKSMTKANKLDIKLLFCLGISIPILYNIRPWGFLIPLVALVLYLYQKNSERIGKKKIIYILFGIAISCGLIAMIPTANANLRLWLPIVLESFTSRGILNNILGIGKLFVGPGPIRSMFGDSYFMYSLLSGNIMCMIGSIMWYLQMPILIVIIKEPIKFIRNSSAFSKYILLTELLYIIIYVMQYGGSTELRFRGTLYIMTAAFVLTTFDLKLNNKKLCIALMIFMILLMSNLFFI